MFIYLSLQIPMDAVNRVDLLYTRRSMLPSIYCRPAWLGERFNPPRPDLDL